MATGEQGRRPVAARLDAVYRLGVVAVVAVFAAGAWERRWIADDGLIVLRTVRNLVAGNGPVFNAGERVESNTSALWTYLVWGAHEVTGIRVELAVLGVALGLSLLAVVAAAAGTRTMLLGTRRHPIGRRLLLLPFGLLVYVMVPPARDFATSGLETGLILAWIGVLWWLLQRWARTPHREARFGLPSPVTGVAALVAGLAPLVRPELVLLGLPVLALLGLSPQGWRHRGWLVLLGGTVPVVYQLWRMSYYGLPYPITAVAKDAGGAKWDKGLAYLQNLLDPYWLLLPLGVALLAGLVVALALGRMAPRAASADDDHPTADDDHPTAADTTRTGSTRAGSPRTLAGLHGRLRSTPAVTATFVIVAAVLLVYEIRVGGDFMHGRVLLPTLFLALLPVAVLPLPVGSADARSGRARRVLVPALGAAWLVVVGWSVWAQVTGDPFRQAPEQVTASGIVDERQYYIQRTGHRHPLLATDYLDFPRMRSLVESVRANRTGAVYIARPTVQEKWDVVSLDHPRPGMQPFEIPEHPEQMVVFLNLGMTSMNLPLDVKVYDTVGLATPLAAHTRRLEDGRIGHDKFLPYDWFLARADVVEEEENYPSWVDVNWINQATVALTCPATRALIDSYTAPLTRERRLENLAHALDFAGYRIDRIPAHEVQRCGLPMPPEVEKHPGTR